MKCFPILLLLSGIVGGPAQLRVRARRFRRRRARYRWRRGDRSVVAQKQEQVIFILLFFYCEGC